MFILRRGLVLSKYYAVTVADLPLQNAVQKSWKSFRNPAKLFATDSKKTSDKIMVDPKRVMSYEDMLKVLHQPKKVIIDVRDPDEVSSTGMIPSSINIPLPNIKQALDSSHDEFQKVYKRDKPSASDELIFYCRSGRRSTDAMDQALKLGYNNSKTYLGSWTEWSSKMK